MPAPLVVILTDFGSTDPYVGIMKGVIARIAPGLPAVDLTQEIPPGDILRGAITLWQAVQYFPEGTIFLCVVDPGVGTHRRPMIMQTGGINHRPGRASPPYTFIGPDNGLFTFVAMQGFSAWQLENPAFMLPAPGKTFHGRDIFAPAAAHAALGTAGADFGAPILDPVQLPLPFLAWSGPQELEGEVLYTDHFGNLVTSLGIFHQPDSGLLQFNPWISGVQEAQFPSHGIVLSLESGARLPLVQTFGEIPAGACAALIGSTGLLEIAANRQSAASLLQLQPGNRVKLAALQ